MMVILPSDDFEKQVLIKVDTKKQPVNIPEPDPEPVIESVVEPVETPKPETHDDTSGLITDFEIEHETTIDDSYDVDNDDDNESETYVRKPLIIEEIIESGTPDMNLEVKPEPLIEASELIPEPVFKLVTPAPDPVEEPQDCKSLINSDLETIDLVNISETSDNSVELKSHEEIYLEIYNAAKQKARDIRKNAITAFLEAKNIKKLYNLEEMDIDSSDDEDDFMNFDQ